ncbi:hypothetical protein [Desulfitobacterium sp.]|uniref:hypothetical protein n=1 Tax=Desulfitobacterium sp. TaxID=49981 RepID=UPI002BF1E7B5|nr:hypothetical protein [Desulfitobacterium sp.]HVJ50605.1 hypothetical protein [Desulfitobacterium sp.]
MLPINKIIVAKESFASAEGSFGVSTQTTTSIPALEEYGGQDNGSILEGVGNLFETEGAATLADFPDVLGDYLTQPSTTMIQTAYPHRIKQWRYLFTPNDTTDFMIQQTKEYLNTGDP